MTKIIEPLAERILREAEDDWIPLDMLLWHSRESAAQEGEDFKQVAIDVLRFLLEGELMEIGDLSASGFEAWIGPLDEIVQRVAADAESVNWEPLGGLSLAFILACHPTC